MLQCHRQILECFWHFGDIAGLRPGDRYLAVLPFGFGGGLNGCLTTSLIHGVTVVPLAVFGPAQTLDLRRDNGKWQMTQPEALPADQDSVGSLVGTFSALNADTVVEAKATDLAPYGLTNPKLDVQIVKKDGKTDNLLIGDETPTGSGSYAKLANDARVFTIGSFVKTSIDKTPNDLRDKRLLTFDQDKASRIELASKKQTIEFGRDKDQWQILKPGPYRADGLQVEELVRKLREAKMDAAVSDEDAKKAATAFASGTPVATVKVTDNTGTQELQVRKSKDDHYAKSSVVEGFHKVPTDLGTGLDKSADDFRNKKLFDFGFTDPNKVELKEGAKFYGFTKGGEEWWSNGKKMDNTSVQNFLDKLRDLSASKFVDSGFAGPTVELTVTSNDGKRVEKVVLSKQGSDYVAKRETEPALYQVDGKTVTGPDLLAKTHLYKVGHHASHNATLRKLGLEQMTNLKIALVPVDHDMAVKKRWGRMPLSELIEALREKASKGVLRCDQNPEKPIDGVLVDKLFFEITL